jgi:diamine N-acetyltransferase
MQIQAEEIMIQYIEISPTEIDVIKPLWEGLRDLQSLKSIDFADELRTNTWEKRKMALINSNKSLKILLAKDLEYIGYCISSITNETKGEIDSIYIENSYRESGIGSEFMKSSLRWFEDQGITDINISVAVGNEEVLDFYKKFGFKPRTLNLKRT